MPYAILFLHDCPFIIKPSTKRHRSSWLFGVGGVVFGFSFHYEVKRLCLVKLTLDKSVCFAPVTLSLSVDFSGPDRDPKRVEGNFLFLPHRAAAIQCRGHRGGPAVPGCLWSCQFSQGLGEGGSLRSPLPGVLSAVCTAGRGGSTEPGHSSPVRRSCSGQ